MIASRFVAGLGLLFYLQSGWAFYQQETGQAQYDARLLLRGFALAIEQADKPELNSQGDDVLGGVGRIIAEAHYQTHWRFEFNIYQTYISNIQPDEQHNPVTGSDVERSAALEWSLSDTEYAHLTVDRLNAYWARDDFNISVGRQAINLASTFFFSPNDFFGPFAAQTFYRVYKPGVDAVQANLSVGELSGLSVIAVQGYRPEENSVSGWSDEPDSSRNSYVTRFVTNRAGFEWAVLAGKVRRTRIVGGSLSGELFDWLGIRAEGHQRTELDGEQLRYSELSVGFEHRWENSLMLQLEQYYHGLGADSVSAYDLQQAYPARRYQALGLSYEFTPLLNGQLSIIRNQLDKSRLYSVNTIYSLGNESELVVSLSVPHGEGPQGLLIKSEFGNYPKIFNLEIRSYF